MDVKERYVWGGGHKKRRNDKNNNKKNLHSYGKEFIHIKIAIHMRQIKVIDLFESESQNIQR
jgi:hypothetical protein